jgi:hypothetical protein
MRMKEGLILRTIAACLVVVLIVGVAGRGQALAMLAPTGEGAAAYNRASDQEKVQSLLERKVIQQRLKDLGYNAGDIERRMDRLSDAQVHQVAMRVDQQLPAGDGGASLWIIVGAVLLLILLIAAIDDDDDDHHDRKDGDADVDVNTSAPAQPANPPQTIIVK